MNKYSVYLSYGLWPLDGGAKLYSYGLCKEFSKYIRLKIFPYCSNRDEAEHIHFDNSEVYPFFKDLDKQGKLTFFWYKLNARITGLYIIRKSYIEMVDKYIKDTNCKYVIIDQICMYEYYAYFKKKYPDKKFIYISHNAESVNYWERYIKGKSLSISLLKEIVKYEVYKRNEKTIIKNADYVFSICKDDINWFNEHYRSNAVIMLCKPLIKFNCLKIDVINFNYNIVFIGSMFWYPNINGIIWFCENVFGELLKIDNRFKLYVVGKNPDKRLYKYEELYKDNFILTGFVESVEPYYKMADIAIIPLFEGMGAKIKVLESMASGVPTIMTKVSASAYDISDEAILADEKEEYIEEILKLRDSYDYRKKIHDRELAFYEKYMILDDNIKEILCK